MPSHDTLNKAATSARPAIVVVTTVQTLRQMLTIVGKASMIYLDLIGQRQVACDVDARVRREHRNRHRGWGSHGPLSVVVLRAFPDPDIFVVDVGALGGHNVFACRSLAWTNNSLRAVLESARIPKVVWDIFDPVDMLWTQFGIRLRHGLDLQLFENAARTSSRLYLCADIEVALKNDVRLGPTELAYNVRCRRTLEERAVRWADLAPLSKDRNLLQYCANCVRYMPRLFLQYMDSLDGAWLTRARDESARRTTAALGRSCDLRSPSRAMGPWGTGAPYKYESFR